MICALVIQPESLRTGVPITVTVGPEAGHRGTSLVVSAVDPSGGEPFAVPLADGTEGHRVGHFVLSLPGRYEITAGATKQTVTVAPQQNLSFAAEFGVFSLAVFLLVGGMVVWLRRSKRRESAAANFTSPFGSY